MDLEKVFQGGTGKSYFIDKVLLACFIIYKQTI